METTKKRVRKTGIATRYLKVCRHCGHTFRPHRKDARYCRSTCRSKASLQRKSKKRGLITRFFKWIF